MPALAGGNPVETRELLRAGEATMAADAGAGAHHRVTLALANVDQAIAPAHAFDLVVQVPHASPVVPL